MVKTEGAGSKRKAPADASDDEVVEVDPNARRSSAHDPSANADAGGLDGDDGERDRTTVLRELHVPLASSALHSCTAINRSPS